jgi:trehalose 6-phosphate phosphatase
LDGRTGRAGTASSVGVASDRLILGSVEEDARRLLAPLAADPERAAVLLDVDGTLAPIVARPELAKVPEETRRELRRLVGRYALIACISGRTGADAYRLVGVDGIFYVGVHGLELAPEADAWRAPLRGFAELDWPWMEDKGLTVAFHWREARDEDAARSKLEAIAERGRASGLEARWGRKVLELRPPVDADKGTAVRSLLVERGLRRAFYAGDDTTDLDAFRGLDGCEVAVRVAIASAESPPGLREAADLAVASPAELVDVLRAL